MLASLIRKSELQAKLEALDRSQAVIEFDIDGRILTANRNFLAVMGYALDEIKGKHHRLFVDPAQADSPSYRDFWASLARGEYQSAEFKRLAKGGREVWIQASYNPILGGDGKPFKIVKFATDVTERHRRGVEHAAQVAAIARSQAVIAFDLDGTILDANENFLAAMGYTLAEIKGQHHRMFVDPATAGGAAYRDFWASLARGQYQSAEFKRVAKGGREVWIQASYNPILDADGKPFKIVKFATDITQQRLQSADHAGQIAAIGKAQAVIEFNLDGTIRYANENFLTTMGYTLDEVRGQHHRMFVEPAYGQSDAYRDFWAALSRGEHQSAEFKRVAKDGREIWIQATYNPILDLNGKPFKVVKFATDITAQRLKSADHAGQIAAIGKAQAVIEFNLDGTIRKANENFLKTMGYALDEVRGKHHRMFVEPAYAQSEEYRQFWATLARGEYQAAEFKRIARGGREVWIQASYNPILDLNGKPFKVVKFATDITAQRLKSADHAGQIAAIGKAQAVIEFDLDGKIRVANQNFLDAMGYTLDEIRGQHHRMFVEPGYAGSREYQDFWAALGRGEYQTAEFKRVAKGGREVWIQASYNPILDLNGKPFKVVKFATDVTAQVVTRMKNEAIKATLETVAIGAEELNASVKQIAGTMTESKQTADKAVANVALADHATKRLTSGAQAMGGIVDLINNITGQINLLALNATIESARAGEAGRGFAVVASEVKNLSGQARSATEQISKEIDGMRAISDDVVAALQAIQHSIAAVQGYTSSTADAIREQSSVAARMSDSMQRAAEVAASIGR